MKEALNKIASGAVALPPIAADGTTIMDTICGFDATAVEAGADGAKRPNLRRAA